MKSALITIAVVPVLAVSVCGQMRSGPSYPGMPPMQQGPPQGQVAAVSDDGVDLRWVPYLKTDGLGTITEIQQHPDGTLTLIGKNGAADFAADLTPGKTTSFESCRGDVVSAPVGKGMYLCRPYGWSAASLIGAGGDKLWTYPDTGKPVAGSDDAVAGELGLAHSPRIALGMNASGGLRLLTPDGKEVWTMPAGNVWHVEIMPGSEATGNVIVHSDAAGKLSVRDENGKVLGRHAAEIYVSDFAPTAWAESPLRDKILAATKQFVYVLSMDGTTVARLPVPDATEDGAPRVQGVPVRLTGGNPYYALIVRHYHGDRWTQLHVYDSANKIVYDERLPGDCAALAAHKNQNKTEDLLLGCGSSVVKYSSSGGSTKVGLD